MKAENDTTGHNRTLRIHDIPDPEGKGYMPTLVITINYAIERDDGQRVQRAVTLDNVVIPAIIKALNA